MTEPFNPFPGLKPIGYWRGPDDPDLPDPGAFVDESWDPLERERVVRVLAAAATHSPGEGCSICRICRQPNGFLDLSDGVLVWPEGLAHYVAEHAVRLPADVVQHLLGEGDPESGPADPAPVDVHIVPPPS